jgi:hypothetical protein
MTDPPSFKGRTPTSIYASSAIREPWHSAAKAQDMSKSELLEEVILLTAPLLGGCETLATHAARAWVRLRQAGHRGPSKDLRHWACGSGLELDAGTVALLTEAERLTLGLSEDATQTETEEKDVQ